LKKFKSALVCILVFWLFLSPTAVLAQDNNEQPIYVVQQGDTLSVIALRFGTTVQALIDANSLQNPNALEIGSTLKIPGLDGIKGVLEIHPVQLGETLFGYNKELKIPVETIAHLNRITSPNEVFAGTSLILPAAEKDGVIKPLGIIGSDKTFLEESVIHNENPWSIVEENQRKGMWEFLPNDLYYGKSTSPDDGFSPFGQEIISVQVAPLPLVQGATVTIFVKTKESVELSGKLLNQDLTFHPVDSNTYLALAGVPAMQDPGLYPFEIAGKIGPENKINFTQPILLEAGSFIQESVIGVDASTIDPVSIDHENTTLNQVVSVNSDRMWTDKFQYPIDKPCAASVFGSRRSYNNGTYNYYHTGMDFTVCAENLNIYAAAPGTVVFSGPVPVRGNFTLIDHGWGVFTGYAHQSKFLVNVGDQVDKGQKIGEIGNTGRSLGPHLHWEVWINHVPINPIFWIEKSIP
jgi:murein DD-endopeptidase MepM/ murein hydrolase activator NlpD